MSSARLSFSLITLLSLAACGGSNTPATNADSGATPTGSVATICAAARRLACTGVTNCESEIGAVFNGFPARCAAARDAYFACAARATNTTCEMISTGQFSSCEALGRTLESCGGDSDSGTPTTTA